VEIGKTRNCVETLPPSGAKFLKTFPKDILIWLFLTLKIKTALPYVGTNAIESRRNVN
jgi:hypothetical protein